MFQNTQIGYPDAKTIIVPWQGAADRTPVAVPDQEMCFGASANISSVSNLCAFGVTEVGNSNQSYMATNFLGIGRRKVATDVSGTIEIDRQAVKQVTFYSASGLAAEVGTMVAASAGGLGGNLLSNTVEATTDASKAIGYVIQRMAAGGTTALVLFIGNMVPSSIPGGSQAINTAANLSLTGNGSVGGTLAVTGATTLTGNLSGGNAALTGTLKAAGLASLKAGTLAAAGTVIGNAAAIAAQSTAVTTTGNAQGVQLPAFAATYAVPLWVKNTDGTNTVLVYPAVNCAIDGGSANAAVALAAGEKRMFFSDGNTNYYSLKGA